MSSPVDTSAGRCEREASHGRGTLAPASDRRGGVYSNRGRSGSPDRPSSSFTASTWCTCVRPACRRAAGARSRRHGSRHRRCGAGGVDAMSVARRTVLACWKRSRRWHSSSSRCLSATRGRCLRQPQSSSRSDLSWARKSLGFRMRIPRWISITNRSASPVTIAWRFRRPPRRGLGRRLDRERPAARRRARRRPRANRARL